MTRKIEALKTIWLENCEGRYPNAIEVTKIMKGDPWRSTNIYTRLEVEGMTIFQNNGWKVTQAGLEELLKNGQIIERVK